MEPSTDGEAVEEQSDETDEEITSREIFILSPHPSFVTKRSENLPSPSGDGKKVSHCVEEPEKEIFFSFRAMPENKNPPAARVDFYFAFARRG